MNIFGPSGAGGNSVSIVTLSSTTSIPATADLVRASGNITLTEPSASANTGKVLNIVKTDSTLANIITLSSLGTTLNTENEMIQIYSDGSAWTILNRYIPSVWVSFTPTGSWSTNTTYTGFWKRVGDSIDVIIRLALAGAPNSAALTVNTPDTTNIVIATAKLPTVVSGNPGFILGNGFIRDTGVNGFPISARYNSTTSLALTVLDASGTYTTNATALTDTVPVTFGNTDEVWVRYSVPVSGWNG